MILAWYEDPDEVEHFAHMSPTWESVLMGIAVFLLIILAIWIGSRVMK